MQDDAEVELEQEDEGNPFLSNIQEDLKEMAEDFHALSRIKEGAEDEEEPFHLPHIDLIADVESESSKKEDSLFKELVFHEEGERSQKEKEKAQEQRPRKVHLSTKHIKK